MCANNNKIDYSVNSERLESKEHIATSNGQHRKTEANLRASTGNPVGLSGSVRGNQPKISTHARERLGPWNGLITLSSQMINRTIKRRLSKPFRNRLSIRLTAEQNHKLRVDWSTIQEWRGTFPSGGSIHCAEIADIAGDGGGGKTVAAHVKSTGVGGSWLVYMAIHTRPHLSTNHRWIIVRGNYNLWLATREKKAKGTRKFKWN